MRDVQVIWDLPEEPTGNVFHIAEHGLTPEEVEDVLLDTRIPVERSRKNGRPCKRGTTSSGRRIFVAWVIESGVDPVVWYPVTAYEIP